MALSKEQNETLRSLKVQVEKFHIELQTAQAELNIAEAKRNKLKARIQKIEAEIARLGSFHKIPLVSEHALVRYLERVHNIDMDRVREELLSPALLAAIQSLGNGEFPMKDFIAVVRQNTVVTIKGRSGNT